MNIEVKNSVKPVDYNKSMEILERRVEDILLGKIKSLEDRRFIWAIARRYSWGSLARQLGCHRVTIKKRYKAAVLTLEFSLDKTMIDKIDKLI